jgi:P4 family phage/plasmid primase-like protien
VYEAANEYVDKGFSVFPIEFPTEGGCSCGAKSCASVGKHPANGAGGHNQATQNRQQIERWFGEKGKYRGYNIGAVCGDGWACLDVDPKNKGLESFEAMIRDHERLPDTWVEETGEDKNGNRGLHYWFLIPPGVEVNTKKPLPGYPGVDLLATSSVYAVVTPSMHKSGVQYEFVTPIDDAVIMPAWLVSLAPGVVEQDVLFGAATGEPTGIPPSGAVREFLRNGGTPAGGQRAMACKAARALWGIRVKPEEAAALIWDAISKCEWAGEPWTENQVHRLVADEYNKQPSKSLEIPQGAGLSTDVGRAYRLRAFARGNLKHTQQSWYTWDSSAWQSIAEDDVREQVHEMGRVEHAQALLSEGEAATSKRKEAEAIQRTGAISNIIREAAALTDIKCKDSIFDTERMLLNCTNCTVDLRTGEPREQHREDYITRTTSFAYYKDATSDLWDEVVDAACSSDDDLIDFLQLAFGYAATGDTREDAFFYFHGPGGTGKTTVLEAVSHALGGYATAADPETFMMSQATMGVSHRADLAALRHARLVTSTEIAQGSRFSTSVLNRLTGQDTISARMPYAKAPIVFKPQWTLFFAANHFPRVPGATKRDGFWRRVKILPFEHRVIRVNPTMRYRLATEEHGPGILRWVVEGAVRWWREYGSKGRIIEVPGVVTEQVMTMQEETDPLEGFVSELVFGDRQKVHRAALHQAYLSWCSMHGVQRPMLSSAFRSAFKASTEDTGVREGQPSIDGKQDRGFFGVGLPLQKAQ